MPKLVKDGVIVEDTWTLLSKPEGDVANFAVPAGQVIVPLSVWLAQKSELKSRTDIGVWLDSDETADLLGELRAVGNFIRDQLCYLRRCGVNAFAFSNPEADLQAALKSLDDFTEYYQASVDQPLPLFRRRA